MKKGIILILSLVGILVCSCKKEPDPQLLFIGTWKATATVTPHNESAVAQEVKGIVFTFGENGKGSFAMADVIEFSYQFIKENNTIRLRGGIDNTLYIDSLKEDSFVFHSSEPAQAGGKLGPMDWTFYGTKIK